MYICHAYNQDLLLVITKKILKRSTGKDLKYFEDSRQKLTSPQKLKRRHTRNLNTNQFEFKLGEDCWDTISEVLVKRSQPVLWPSKVKVLTITRSQSTDSYKSQSAEWSQDAEDSILYLVCLYYSNLECSRIDKLIDQVIVNQLGRFPYVYKRIPKVVLV